MSNSGICHAFNTTHHEQTKKFTPYKTLDESLKALVFMLKKSCMMNHIIIEFQNI